MFRVLRFSTEAKEQLAELGRSPATGGTLKQVNKALGYLQINPAHPSLNRRRVHSPELAPLSSAIPRARSAKRSLGPDAPELAPGWPSEGRVFTSHEFTALSTRGRKVFEAYAQNNTPGAYRIFWYYGPDQRDPKTKKNISAITVFAIIAHPA